MSYDDIKEIRREKPCIYIDYGEQEDGGHRDHFIELPALATWGELLGYADMAESLSAIIAADNNGGQPEADPETGWHVFTDAFTLLEARERAREDEAARAHQEGTQDDPRSPYLRASLAAYNAVHQPIDGGECALDRVRRVARDTLGCPEPSGQCGALTRGAVPMAMNTGTPESRVLNEEALDYLGEMRTFFLHSLSGRSDDDNPMGDTPEPPPPENPIESADELLARYGATDE